MLVSIIIPMRNEEKFVRECLDSLLGQIEGRANFEVFCIDGASTDGTRRIVFDYTRRDKRIHLIDNPQKIVPISFNLGIKQTKGDVVMIFGTHARYAPDYIDKCLELLERTGADNVGGYLTTVASKDTPTARAIASATSSAFGVGGSGQRVGGEEREADTAVFGCFRSDVFKRIGLFDERLVRGQDIELNSRIRKAGGRIIVSPDIKVYYFNRATFRGLCLQSFHNAVWNAYTMYLTSSWVLSRRHLVPLIFVLSLIASALAGFVWPFFWILLAAELLLYLSVGIASAIKTGRKTNTSSLLVLIAYTQLHIPYGLGWLWGFITVPFKFGLKRTKLSGKTLEYTHE